MNNYIAGDVIKVGDWFYLRLPGGKWVELARYAVNTMPASLLGPGFTVLWGMGEVRYKSVPEILPDILRLLEK